MLEQGATEILPRSIAAVMSHDVQRAVQHRHELLLRVGGSQQALLAGGGHPDGIPSTVLVTLASYTTMPPAVGACGELLHRDVGQCVRGWASFRWHELEVVSVGAEAAKLEVSTIGAHLWRLEVGVIGCLSSLQPAMQVLVPMSSHGSDINSQVRRRRPTALHQSQHM